MVVAALKTEDSVFHLLSVCEVVGRKCLSLKDGEVDLDLVEPACVDGKMDGDQVSGKPSGVAQGRSTGDGKPHCPGSRTRVRPKHRSIRLLLHHEVDQSLKGFDPRGLIHTTKDFSASDIECGQVGHGPMALVVRLTVNGFARSRR